MLVDAIEQPKFHPRLPYAKDDLTLIDYLLLCSEKPDISKVEVILEAIANTAPPQLKKILDKIRQFSTEIDRDKFEADMASLKLRLLSVNVQNWQLPTELTTSLGNAHLYVKDGVDPSNGWEQNFIRQVQNIRFCHLRQIAKKGTNLHGKRYFDADQRPSDDPNTVGRVAAAIEVMEAAPIDEQAQGILKVAKVQNKLHPENNKLVIHLARPVKDYLRQENSINVLTITHAKMLLASLKSEAKELFPGVEIQIVDNPVVMRTTTNRTDATPFERLLKQPLFDAPELEGKNVVLADDHVNAGAFLATISSYLRQDNANLMGITTFSAHPGSAPLTGEKGGKLEKIRRPLACCSICKNTQSRWTRQNNFARIWRVPQEAKSERARSVFIVARGQDRGVRYVGRHLVQEMVP